jgi:hypothetical protein
MPRVQTVVETPLAVSRFVATDTTLALASHPKSSRRVPLPGGVTCGSAVEAERDGSGQMARARGGAQGTQADRKVPRESRPGLYESRSIAKTLSFSAINQSLAYADYLPASPQDQQRRH